MCWQEQAIVKMLISQIISMYRLTIFHKYNNITLVEYEKRGAICRCKTHCWGF
jgi:hypothetical protein